MFLVTGAGGFIGQHVLSRLVTTFPKEQVIALYHRNKPREIFNRKQVRFLQANLCNPPSLDKIPTDFHTLIDLASYVPRKRPDMDHPDNFKNISMASALRHFIHRKAKKLRTIIYASSISVYEPKGGTLRENRTGIPQTLYGLTKRICETMWKDLEDQNQSFKLVILRFSSVYGYGQEPNSVLPLFIDRARRNIPIQLFGGGMRFQDFIYVNDVCDAIVKAIRKSKPGIYNIGSGTKTTMKSLAYKVWEKFGTSAPRVELTSKKESSSSQVFSVKRAAANFGFRASYTLDSGLMDMQQAMRGKNVSA